MQSAVQCKQCGARFDEPSMRVGQMGLCPVCGAANVMPKPREEPSDDHLPGDLLFDPAPQIDLGELAPRQPPGAQASALSHVDAMGRRQGADFVSLLRARRRGSMWNLGVLVCVIVVVLAAVVGVGLMLSGFMRTDGGGGAEQIVVAPVTGRGGTYDELAKSQNRSHDTLWAPVEDPSGRSLIDLESVRVDMVWSHEGRVNQFNVAIRPRAQITDAMKTSAEVVLFRGESADGPFHQLDRVSPKGVRDGALLFALHDAVFAHLGHNRFYYRLSGADPDGRRWFDTPAADVPVVEAGRVLAGRFQWEQAGDDGEPPVVGATLRLEDELWRGVSFGLIEQEGSMDVELPVVEVGEPVQVLQRFTFPSHIVVDGRGHGRWVSVIVEHPVGEIGRHSDLTAQAIVPVFTRPDRITHRVIGDETFYDISANGTEVTFRVHGDDRIHRIQLPRRPAPMSPVVTPYEDAIRVSWDTDGAVSAGSAFSSMTGLAVYRKQDGADERLLSILPPDEAGFTDTTVEPGRSYEYIVRLVHRDAPSSPGQWRAEAFIAGVGVLPVLIDCPFEVRTPMFSAEPGVREVHVVLGQSELVYPDTDMLALEVADGIRSAVLDAPGVSLIERGTVDRLRGVTAAAHGELLGAPGHVVLQLTDTLDEDQRQVLQLWACDLGTGQTKLIHQDGTDRADADGFVRAAMSMLRGRGKAAPTGDADMIDGGAPARVVFGPLLPVVQRVVNYRGPTLVDVLAEAISGDGFPPMVTHVDADAEVRGWTRGGVAPGTVLLTGRVWHDDVLSTRATVYAIDAVSGRLLSRFEAASVDDNTPAAFASWFARVRVPGDVMGTRPGEGLSLLSMEAGRGFMNDVYTAHTGDLLGRGAADDAQAPTGATVLSFGSPYPGELESQASVRLRGDDEPLRAVQPIVAAPATLGSDQWIVRHAQYLADDTNAFIHGIRQLNAATAEGEIIPYVIVRGRVRVVDHGALRGDFQLSEDHRAMAWRTLLPIGPRGSDLLDYSAEHRQRFSSEPYLLHRAWIEARVPERTATAFLHAQLTGPSGEGGAVPISRPTHPPTFEQYMAAVAMEARGHPGGAMFRQEARVLCEDALDELISTSPNVANDVQKSRWASDTLLILAYEHDTTAMDRLRDDRFREQYLHVSGPASADTARMLVDCVGDEAFAWARSWRGVRWEQFRWKDPEEKYRVSERYPDFVAAPAP